MTTKEYDPQTLVNEHYWVCTCDNNYILSEHTRFCPVCGTEFDEDAKAFQIDIDRLQASQGLKFHYELGRTLEDYETCTVTSCETLSEAIKTAHTFRNDNTEVDKVFIDRWIKTGNASYDIDETFNELHF